MMKKSSVMKMLQMLLPVIFQVNSLQISQYDMIMTYQILTGCLRVIAADLLERFLRPDTRSPAEAENDQSELPSVTELLLLSSCSILEQPHR